jgi:ATP-binding cassette, subfamily B (MDR/TAP), member 1
MAPGKINVTDGGDGKDKPAAVKPKMASIGETLNFAFECGGNVKLLFVLGAAGAFLNGLVYPMLAYMFSNSFSDISSASSGSLKPVRDLAFQFMLIGVYALICGTIQTLCLEVFSVMATKRLRLEWFKALLRQDASYFDVNDIGGIAGQVGPSANKYRRGMGRKLGEGIQFLTTGVGGIVFAFYAEWRVALLVLAVIPFCAFATITLVSLNQTKGTRGGIAYKAAAGVAYSAISAFKTVLSLNGVKEMISRYEDATQEAYVIATAILIKYGLANGKFIR